MRGEINKDIITGADYQSKAKKFNFSVFKDMKECDTLVIVGYSGHFNDHHINKVIKESESIKRVIYFYYEYEKISERDKVNIISYFTNSDGKRMI